VCEQMPAILGSPVAISLVLHKPPSAYFVCGAPPVRHVCVEEGGLCLRAKKRWQRREPKSSSRRSSSSRSVVSMVRCSSGLQQQFPEPVVSGFGAPLPRLQDLDPSTMLLQQRILFLGSQVDDFTADVIISQLLLLDAQDPTKDIKLFINSPGGSVTAGMGIYDAMKLCRADVSTVCFGLAASMGAFLLAAGSKGKRYCMPNARVMIHQPLGGAGGSAIDVGLQVREMMYHKVKLTKIMSRLTGKSEEQVFCDWFFSARSNGLVSGLLLL
jgi:ATP-dependent Clp protease protease subunit